MNDQNQIHRPLAITMWDFSWIERRWIGGGYENWDKVLDELIERGYNAVRIDAFPHLVSKNASKEWTLKPVWRVQDWGSPALNKIVIQPQLNEFIAKCKARKIKVGLSSWFREDVDNVRMEIANPSEMAEIWYQTLKTIDIDDLLDNIFYVDLCNEWPGSFWAPYFTNNPSDLTWGGWYTEESIHWMKESILLLKNEFPSIPFGYSIELHKKPGEVDQDLYFVDYHEPHIWMSNSNNGEFYKRVGYEYDTDKYDSYDNLILNGEKEYRSNPEYWHNVLFKTIDYYIGYSRKAKSPLMTTECWGVVDYKDWPLLNWGWIKELCELGTKKAADSGRWAAIGTSNFCGPQFKGMWNDVDWHKNLTEIISNSNIDKSLIKLKLVERILSIDE